MKEYIFQLDSVSDGNVIQIASAPAGLTKKNVLAIINKSTKGIVHSPLVDGVTSVTYSGTTLSINLKNGHVAIAGNLLIKCYKDEDGGYDQMIAEFFGLPGALPEYQQMSEQEVMDTLEDIMGSLDTYLGETVEYPEGSGQYMSRAQAITAQVNETINN